MARRKALARKISYNQARSYRRTYPNPIGVTAIAAVNGRGSYNKRYAQTRKLLRNPPTANLEKMARKWSEAGMDPEVVRATLKRYGEAEGYTSAQIKQASAKVSGKKARKTTARKTTARKTAAPRKPKETKVAVRKKTSRKKRKAMTSRHKKYGTPMPAAAAKKVSKAYDEYQRAVAAQKRATTAAAKKRAAAAVERKKAALAKSARAKTTKKAASAKPKMTAAQRKAATRKKAAARRSRQRAQYSKRVARSKKKSSRPPRVHGGVYPAARAILGTAVVKDTYVWETPTGALRKIPLYALLGFSSKKDLARHFEYGAKDSMASELSGKYRYEGRKRIPLTWREFIALRMKRIQERRDKAAERMKRSGGVFVPNRRRGKKRTTRALSYKQWESASMKKNRRKRRRKKTRKNATRAQIAAAKRNIKKAQAARKRRRKTVANRKRRTVANRKRRTVANRKRRTVANRKRRTVANRKRRATTTPNRRRRATKRRSTRATKRRTRRHTVRRYRPNQYVSQLKKALKVGLIITGGYAGHRILSKLLGQTLLADNEYKDVISGSIVAAVGVPLSVKFIPGDAKLVGAGMMVSLIQTGLVTLVNKLFGEEYGQYLAGLGSYYQYTRGQQYPRRMNGYGEYIRRGTSGFGRITQAAAGVGRITQAAAGMGQARLTQAAAGAGEYIAAGAAGIGDYEEVLPEYTRPVPIDEGIAPDLTTAEQALNVAEAAAGIGGGAMGEYLSLPSQSTIEPQGVWTGLNTAPDAERQGTFQGNNGIFGS